MNFVEISTVKAQLFFCVQWQKQGVSSTSKDAVSSTDFTDSVAEDATPTNSTDSTAQDVSSVTTNNKQECRIRMSSLESSSAWLW